MKKKLILSGSIIGFLAIVLGAFGSHILKNRIEVHSFESYQTGVRYQMYQAFLLIILPTIGLSNRIKNRIYYLIIVGLILFSGVIYINTISGILDFDLGKITLLIPLGGVSMIASWALLVVAVFKSKTIKD